MMENDFKFDESSCLQFVEGTKRVIASLPARQRKEDFAAIFNCIDNTTLNSTDCDSTVADFCRTTLSLSLSGRQERQHVASVCVYPTFVSHARKFLDNSGIAVAAVAGCFPTGQTFPAIKADEVAMAVDQGADEIDYVINRGFALSGRFDLVSLEVSEAKRRCGDKATLKVILETGELNDPQTIYAASVAAMRGGADFIKTSTGKIAVGATPLAAYVMLNAIAHFNKKTKKSVGFKVAGGLSDSDSLLLYYYMTKNLLDIESISNQIFRVGTSRLTKQVFDFLTV